MTRAASIALALLAFACTGLGQVTTTTTSTTTSTTTTTTLPPTTTTTEPPTQLTGSVTDAHGRPVVGADVAFGDAIGSSDAAGAFSLATHSPGPVSVTKRGYVDLEIPWVSGTIAVSGVMDNDRIRGLRVSPETAGNDEAFRALLDLAGATAVNALVFDTKQEGGKVLYQTAVPDAHALGAVDPWYDPSSRIALAHEEGLYLITRIVVFEDALWVSANPEEKLAGPWAHPNADGVRQYAIDLAVEACNLGFDEVQFDYVRWPAGRTAEVSGQLDIPQDDRVAAIEGFLGEARAALAPLGCSLSADIFGIVVSTNDDQGLGQRPEELSTHLDALSPMIYPSHYSLGWLGYPDPNDYPYEVTANAIDAAMPRLQGGVLRPWLQGFWWTDSHIRQSIQAAEDRGVGWVLWNIRSDYSADALPLDSEVGD